MCNKNLFCILISVFLIACSGGKDKYQPEKYLNLKEQDQVMHSIIRYIAKLPRRTADSLRMLDKYDDHYERQISQHRLMNYYVSKDGENFFLVTRRAPSIHEKYVAVGGRMRLDKNNELVEYEEVFRTWKLFENEINERAPYLFDLMVRGEDLTPYYTATAGFNYIEFPDDNVYYDKEARAWKSKTYGSVEEMVYEK